LLMSSRAPLEQRVMQRLKLRELRILITVAHAGSMGKAATQLSLSQPAVSKAIAEMEYTLGVALLDRTPQGVEPTLYGRALLKWAVAAFDDLSQGVREIESLADPAAGEVRVGSHEVMSAGLLPAVIDRLSRRYPRLAFTVKQAATIPSLYDDLRERRVDLIFGRMMASVEHEDLNAEILFDDPLIIVAGSRSKWLRRRAIDLAELIDEPWCLMPDDLPIAPFVAEAFRSLGLKPPRVTVRANSPHLFYAMARTGRFLTIAEASTVQLNGRRLGLRSLPVKLVIQPGPVGIVTLKNRTISPVAQRFIDCAREFIRVLGQKKGRDRDQS
jgi:DNA-binding transcriptional LysR family regulator